MVESKIPGKKTEKSKIFFKIVFYCVLAFSIFVLVYLTTIMKNDSQFNKDTTQYIEQWTVIDQNGRSKRVGRTYDNDRAYSEDFTIVSKLPTDIKNGNVMCFRNRSTTKVYINGVLRKDFIPSRDTVIPGGAVKEFYMTVPLSPADAGAEVRIFRGVTNWNPEIVPETFITSEAGVNEYLINKYGVSFVLDAMLLVAALLVTIIGIILRIWKRQTLDMLYGALGILNVACWLMCVSQLTPIITQIYFVDGVMGFILCMMMPFALIIYLNSIQKGRYRVCFTVLVVLSLLNFIFWTVMHFTGTISYQDALIPIDSVLGVVVLCALITLIIDLSKGKIKEYAYTAIGFLLFIVMSFVQIIVLIFFEELSSEVPMLIGLLFLLAFVVIQQIYDYRLIRSQLEDEVQQKNVENEQMLIHIVKTLAGTIDAKDKYTKGHSSRVADYSREIARRYGYTGTELTNIYMMGLLHDIGKIGIPDSVINKPGKLTDKEFELIKTHPVLGGGILRNIKEMPELAWCARCHHEKYDGTGYPDGFKGEEIPEQARIVAVADAYDAMTSYRSYRDPMPQKKVLHEIEKGSGTQFDPQFAKIMLQMIEEDKNYDLCEKKDNEYETT